jgi:acetylglutamate kinase
MKPEHVDLLRQALPYINKFKNQTFVVKIGGDIAEQPANLHSFCEEVALCAQVGVHIVMIHGGGKQATDLSEKLGIEPRIISGRRVTDDKALDVVKMVFAGKINTEILGSLRKAGVSGVGISGLDGDIIHASKRPPTKVMNDQTGKREMVDFGHVGDIEKVDVKLLTTLLAADFIPVIASLGADAEGNVLNINADTVASRIGGALRAEKLILASDVDGILRGDGTLINRATVAEVQGLIKEGVIKGGMIPKAQAVMDALKDGVHSVHIINGMKPSTLLTEIFTDSGCGTMIYRNGA